MTPDTFPGNVSDPGSWHRYSYVGNNPINRLDPLGLRAEAAEQPSRLDQLQSSNTSGGGGGGGGGPSGGKKRDDEEEKWKLDWLDVVFLAVDIADVPSGEGVLAVGARRALREGAERGVKRAGREAAEEGIKATKHGAERLAERGFTKAEYESVKEVGRVMEQADGAKVFIKEIEPGKFNVVVEGERGVITAVKDLDQHALDNLAKNYGWK